MYDIIVIWIVFNVYVYVFKSLLFKRVYVKNDY